MKPPNIWATPIPNVWEKFYLLADGSIISLVGIRGTKRVVGIFFDDEKDFPEIIMGKELHLYINEECLVIIPTNITKVKLERLK